MHEKPHHRHFMTNDRKSVKAAIKKKNSENLTVYNIVSSSEGDDSEVEFVDSPYLRSKRQAALQLKITPSNKQSPWFASSPSDFSSNHSRAQSSTSGIPDEQERYLNMSNCDASFELTIYIYYSYVPPPVHDSDQWKLPSTSYLDSVNAKSASPLPIHKPTSDRTALEVSEEHMMDKPWPTNMYAIDMVSGFKSMDKLLRNGRSNFETRFQTTFKRAAPASSTYYDQVKRWKNAPEHIREAALVAGRTEEGKWARFSQLVRLKN